MGIPLLSLSALCAVLPLQAAAPALEDYLADLGELTALVEARWSHLEERRKNDALDLDALRAAAEASVRADPTLAGFERALRRFVAGLHDGHAGVRVPGVSHAAPRRWPVTLVEVQEGVKLDGVWPGAGAGLARGDLLLAVDGADIQELLRAEERETFASTNGARRRAALARVAQRTEREELRLRVRRLDGGREEEVLVPCPAADAQVPAPSQGSTRRAWRMLDETTGYLRPGSFIWPAESDWAGAAPEDRGRILAGEKAELARAFVELGAARSLILDLRGNPGGTDLLGQALAGHLLPSGFPYFTLQGRGEDGAWHQPFTYPIETPADTPRFFGPLAVLVDAGTFSTADNLAGCLRDERKDAVFVGRPNGAGTGAPTPFTLARTGARVTFCTQRVWSPGGTYTEGTGVRLDVPVVLTRADLLAGRDADLEAARAALRR
jgi:carboxyl-terminal processing protease